MDATTPEQLSNMPPTAEQQPAAEEQQQPNEKEQIKALKDAINESLIAMNKVYKKISEIKATQPEHEKALQEVQNQNDAFYADKLTPLYLAFKAAQEAPDVTKLESIKSEVSALSAEIQQSEAKAQEAVAAKPAAEPSPAPQPDKDLLGVDFGQVPDQRRNETPAKPEQIEALRDVVKDLREAAAQTNNEVRALSAANPASESALNDLKNKAQLAYLKLTEINTELLSRDDFDAIEIDSLFADAKAEDARMGTLAAEAKRVAAEPAPTAAPDAAPASAPEVVAAPAQEATPATPPAEPEGERYVMMNLEQQVAVWKQAMKRMEQSGVNPETIKNAEANLKNAREEYLSLKTINRKMEGNGQDPAVLIEAIVSMHERLGGSAQAEKIRAKLAEAFPAQGFSDAEAGPEIRNRVMKELMELGNEGLQAEINAAKRKPSKDKGWLDKLPYVNEESSLQRQRANLQDELRGALRSLFDFKAREGRIRSLEQETIPQYETQLKDASRQGEFDERIREQVMRIQDVMLKRFEAWKKLNAFVNGLRPEAAKALATHPDQAPDNAPLSSGERRIYNEYKKTILDLKHEEDLSLEAIKNFMGAGPQQLTSWVEDLAAQANHPEQTVAASAEDDTDDTETNTEADEGRSREQQEAILRSQWFEETSDRISGSLGEEFPTLKGSGDLARMAKLGLSPQLSDRLNRLYESANRTSFTDQEAVKNLNAMRYSVMEALAKESIQNRGDLLESVPVAEASVPRTPAERAATAASEIAKAQAILERQKRGESSAEKEQKMYDSILLLTQMLQDKLGNQRTSSLVKHKESLVKDIISLNESTDPRKPIDALTKDAKEKMMRKVLHVYEAMNGEPYRPAIDGSGAEYVQKIADALGVDTEDLVEETKNEEAELEKKRARARELNRPGRKRIKIERKQPDKPTLTVRPGGKQRRAAA